MFGVLNDLSNNAFLERSGAMTTLTEDELQAEREAMVCTPAQGQIALGKDRWMQVIDYSMHPDNFVMQCIITSSPQWKRTSQDMQMLGQHVMGMTDEEMDDLFRKAMAT